MMGTFFKTGKVLFFHRWSVFKRWTVVVFIFTENERGGFPPVASVFSSQEGQYYWQVTVIHCKCAGGAHQLHHQGRVKTRGVGNSAVGVNI